MVVSQTRSCVLHKYVYVISCISIESDLDIGRIKSSAYNGSHKKNGIHAKKKLLNVNAPTLISNPNTLDANARQFFRNSRIEPAILVSRIQQSTAAPM